MNHWIVKADSETDILHMFYETTEEEAAKNRWGQCGCHDLIVLNDEEFKKFNEAQNAAVEARHKFHEICKDIKLLS
jgi:hypothetical protein